MHLLAAASDNFNYGVDLSEVARIWKGGCIIRAKLLDIIKNIYRKNPGLSNLLLSDELRETIFRRSVDLRKVLIEAKTWEVPTPAMSASLNYYDAYRMDTLPANLIQAQRDYFGAHTYQRVDRGGIFHTSWQA